MYKTAVVALRVPPLITIDIWRDRLRETRYTNQLDDDQLHDDLTVKEDLELSYNGTLLDTEAEPFVYCGTPLTPERYVIFCYTPGDDSPEWLVEIFDKDGNLPQGLSVYLVAPAQMGKYVDAVLVLPVEQEAAYWEDVEWVLREDQLLRLMDAANR